MKTLIISDIHQRHKTAQKIIDNNSADEIILLGDYFDDFNDSPDDALNTAKWLKSFLKNKKHIALMGNHELNYMYNKKIQSMGGYSNDKKIAINSILDTEDWNKLIPYYYTQGYWLTHAGITERVFCNPGWSKSRFKWEIKQAMESLKMGKIEIPFKAGCSRGGNEFYGGILWCDFNDDFVPIKEIKQIFGHTPGQEVRKIKKNYCMDTHNKHFLIIDNGEVLVEKNLYNQHEKMLGSSERENPRL